MHLTLPNKIVAQGEFRTGDPAKPAVLLLHGFLQTHNFPTIHRLVEALSDEGYTVLAPTLSLGIPHRGQSVACEAIHTHTVAQGAEELNAWVKWLSARQVRQIILAGHSIGNIYNLAYLSSYPDSRVKKLIGISIVEGRLKIGEPARAGLVRDLRKAVQEDKRKTIEHQFSFCQRFHATRESLLSYLEWGPDKILTAVRKANLPVTMIMGGKDDRLGADWVDRLKKTPARVIIIPGANHFMDGQHEFDLVDEFLNEMKLP
ncbi:MAG: alpha/beta fold hydrolase [Pseudomonadota bacterium]